MNLKKSWLVILFAVTLSSCEIIDFEDLLVVDVETTLSGNLDINIGAEGLKAIFGTHDFEAYDTINPADYPEINEYINLIDSVEVNGARAIVLSVNKPDVSILEGSIFFIANDTLNAQMILSEDWMIMEGDTLTLDLIGDTYGIVEDILFEMKEFEVGAKGSSNSTDVEIDLKIELDATLFKKLM